MVANAIPVGSVVTEGMSSDSISQLAGPVPSTDICCPSITMVRTIKLPDAMVRPARHLSGSEGQSVTGKTQAQ